MSVRGKGLDSSLPSTRWLRLPIIALVTSLLLVAGLSTPAHADKVDRLISKLTN